MRAPAYRCKFVITLCTQGMLHQVDHLILLALSSLSLLTKYTLQDPIPIPA